LKEGDESGRLAEALRCPAEEERKNCWPWFYRRLASPTTFQKRQAPMIGKVEVWEFRLFHKGRGRGHLGKKKRQPQRQHKDKSLEASLQVVNG